jgi:hypothetical protein
LKKEKIKEKSGIGSGIQNIKKYTKNTNKPKKPIKKPPLV